MSTELQENKCWPCANCCKNSVIRIRESDLQRWKNEDRQDILIYLEEAATDAVFMPHKKER